uniref:Uncharacterized protein n=1 Tax=Cannabis sativa TaxID=3483 RepID=A0A803NSR8_CANSA
MCREATCKIAFNEVFRACSQIPRNHNIEEETCDPLLANQGIPPTNTNNAEKDVNPPLAPVVPNDVVVPANIALVAPPPGNQIAPANNPLLPGGVDQEIVLRVLRMIEQ